jgi:aryl-alcohol dehydrogenase-like predicted oxidoreductase
MEGGATCAIPGAKRADQVDANVSAADLPPLSESQMSACRVIYDRFIRRHVHHRW